jgi:hypothetical protein
MPDYVDYYDRTIQNHGVGFKLVGGGTGLGKTSAIRKLITLPAYQGRKFIYCTNRKQLLEEMAQELKSAQPPGSPACYVMLRRDLEVVLDTLKNFQNAFYDLLGQRIFLDNLGRWNDKYRLKRVDLPAVKRACKALEELLSLEISQLPQLLQEQANEQAALVLAAFKAVLLAANNKSGSSPSYQQLADHPVVQSLFPYIAFQRRPHVRLLLVTLQKAFYGFFDGRQTLNLTRLQNEDGGHTIFLDEFDFLENDLVGLICRAPQISNPFHFVELFYRAMTRHKLPLETYPLSQSVRDRIQWIIGIVDALHDKQRKGNAIDFPNVNQFTSSLPQKFLHARDGHEGVKMSPTIFRTRHTISTESLYLHHTKRSFDLTSEKVEPSGKSLPSALQLFDTVSRASTHILQLFKELERGKDEITYREMIRHCFQDTVFPEQMALISQFSRSEHEQRTQLGALLDSGYSLYDIEDLQQRTDRAEVEVRHYGMYLTPEMILRALSEHNLVFGLSATADIARHVHNFNLDWLAQQVEVIPQDETDKDIIRERNRLKAAARNNKVNMAILDDLDASDEYQRNLDAFLTAVATDEDFGEDTRSGHLKRRVQRFFAALLWMCLHADESSTHLLFLNTFRQIKLIFEREQYHTQDEGLFEVAKRASNRWFDAYEIALRGRVFIVVFYNAQVATMVRQNPEAQHTFDHLFWQGKPVLVVTQYLSAGNGVNLQYKPYEGSKEEKDFTHISLLETPYFYFSKPDPELPWDERIAALKENIWYQAKLFAGKAINERRFRQALSTLNASSEWNARYQTDLSTATDALFNHMATFMQALGRVERIWTEMPDQTVLLSQDVYERFQAFCSPRYTQLRAEREPLISNNLRQLLELVSESLSQREDAVQRSKDARLAGRNEQCEAAVRRLLTRLEGLRHGSGDRDARDQWQRLRQAALKHDFSSEILKEYKCAVESPYAVNGILHLTPQQEIIPAHLAQPDSRRWRMDAIYDVLVENRVICDYFLGHGYELAFNRLSRQFFTPYCYQAILVGAVGEEAIAALLQDEEVKLEETPDALFEVADTKISDRPYYIDCKYYGELTLEQLSADAGDDLWHPKLNEQYFRQNARGKLEKIAAYHGEQGKLIYLNLASSQERPLSYYDADFSPVSHFADAAIVIIQGVLQRHAPNAYYQAFEYFLQDLTTDLEEGER